MVPLSHRNKSNVVRMYCEDKVVSRCIFQMHTAFTAIVAAYYGIVPLVSTAIDRKGGHRLIEDIFFITQLHHYIEYFVSHFIMFYTFYYSK